MSQLPPGPVPVSGGNAAEGPGTTLGRYTILEVLGQGGFGTVYRAEQSEPVRRQVALKILKLGMDTREVVARFEAERQALARMDHPSIAKVHDAGTTATGRPYFVMEPRASPRAPCRGAPPPSPGPRSRRAAATSTRAPTCTRSASCSTSS
jgi:hypothetical protein